ncbi:glycosyltransferase family 8 protein [Brucella thiophenivorans]|uniref:glycosyltransferase family 8 protein n=1 Tax=Brucella thiophenivorans TaxID=571255 RepID=UPI001AECC729|nr:glycosyltransferase family 8 protein [Brucella thiophenivorans]
MTDINPTENPPQIAFVTDRGFLKPTLVAMWGVLRHLSVPGIIHFWGDGLSDQDWEAVKRVAMTNPSVSLRCLMLSADDLDGAKGPTEHISAASMGRLHIPTHISGRVLYIDGDTQVVGDVAPLFSLDLNSCPIGAVRDCVVAKWSVRSLKVREKSMSRVRELQGLMAQSDISRYFNSGVLLLDTDAIRAEPELHQAMHDLVRASACPLGDQDHLNNVFRGRVHLLNPAYNSSWRQSGRQRRHIARLGGEVEERKPVPDIIIHFHGAEKPWKNPRRDLWKRRARAVWHYRREMQEYVRAYPDLAP